jgi:uncharacterized protein
VELEQLRAAFERTTGERVEVHETHISWVLVGGERALKLKKPVVLPFLDYGSPERRRRMCAEEVRLNRRLAPDIYLGVRSVVDGEDGLELATENDSRALDYVVEMRRYDERETLAARLHRGELTRRDAEHLGDRLARFHAACRPVHRRRGGRRATEYELERNVAELLAITELGGERRQIGELGRFLAAAAGARADELEERRRHGLVRDGHGDLRCEHVVLRPQLAVVDCVEFDQELRTLDVADDLAFLLMDLTARGGERFARAVVGGYRTAGGDCGDDQLLSLFAVHRALVRAKVLLVAAGQRAPSAAAHGHLSAQARDLIGLAGWFSWRARLPLVLIVCGPPASGKSTLAATLSDESGLARISSDVVRKRLAGLAATVAAQPRHYTDEFSLATYRELGHRAAKELARNGGAIVDATFRRRAHRAAFASGFAAAGPVAFVRCDAPLGVRAARARARRSDPSRVSDADERIVAQEHGRWEPLHELAGRDLLAVRSDRPAAEVRADVLAWLDQRLASSSPRGTTSTAHDAS